jgi:hypothetical protein
VALKAFVIGWVWVCKVEVMPTVEGHGVEDICMEEMLGGQK